MLSCGSHFNDMRINGLAYSPKTDSRAILCNFAKDSNSISVKTNELFQVLLTALKHALLYPIQSH